MSAQQHYFGEILVRRGVVPEERLLPLFETMRERGQSLMDLLIQGNVTDEQSIAKALAEECGYEFMPRIDTDAVPLEVAERLPLSYVRQRKILPLGIYDGVVFCILADPLDTTAIDDVRSLFGMPVNIAVATNTAVVDAINRVWERKENDGGNLQGDQAHEDDNLVDIIDSDDDAPIIAWVNSLFAQAVRERASDIHIEPEERDVVVRYRIDGELYVARRASKQFMAPIIARVKIMASLNIAEKRLPQDGRITLKIAGKSVDIRVSTVPTSRGFERIVMRILHKTSVLLHLTDLGFAQREYGVMDGLIQRPDGIILVTGPTGSGKTTTLYACLNRINDPSRNILTAEDPVEYEIGGIHQVHVHPGIGLTFASALRAFLRQDPDVIMVGEIRDKETAEIAIHASLTGHLVLSTIHTNDAPGAVTRLVEMEIEPFLVRSSVIGILGQRLVRMLCQQCKVPYRPTDYELQQLGLDKERLAWKARRKLSPRYQVHGQVYDFIGKNMGDPVFYKPGGCEACMNKGFIGRRGIYELMVVDDAIGPLILKSADAQTIKRVATLNGMDTMRDDGARKVLMGMTTVEEVLAATQEDVVIDE
ncbi:type II secretion system ATPase GspE [Chondromyces crocatus]|uniref:protein-secreting ATPase n=1 Tax=Chondromyces crocatus TaxID=52 RepID=A0A0K1E7R0_CHOCO|nr:type II secretion system ATPase GspE [Chondromyces crocatus]AKT36717.1 type II secretion system protein E [Chondromyces crocatus]